MFVILFAGLVGQHADMAGVVKIQVQERSILALLQQMSHHNLGRLLGEAVAHQHVEPHFFVVVVRILHRDRATLRPTT